MKMSEAFEVPWGSEDLCMWCKKNPHSCGYFPGLPDTPRNFAIISCPGFEADQSKRLEAFKDREIVMRGKNRVTKN